MRTAVFQAFKVIITVAIVAAFTFLLYAIADVFYQEQRASKFLKELSRVKVGQTSEANVRLITQHYTAYLNTKQFRESGTQPGEEHFTFRNSILAKLTRVREKFVYVNLTYQNGVVEDISVQYFEQPRMSASVTLSSLQCGDKGGGRKVSRSVYGPGMSSIRVQDGCLVPFLQTVNDLDFDLSCFTSIFPCKGPLSVIRAGSIPTKQ